MRRRCIGSRMDINLTRRLVEAALNGELENVEYHEDDIFHLKAPITCEGVPPEVLWPINTWKDKEAFYERARKLAKEFSDHYDKAYAGKIDPDIAKVCPGK